MRYIESSRKSKKSVEQQAKMLLKKITDKSGSEVLLPNQKIKIKSEVGVLHTTVGILGSMSHAWE
jgi:hypothetical protein